MEKPLGIFEPFLVHVITSARPTNMPKMVEIGSQGAPPRSGEMYRSEERRVGKECRL